MIAKQSVNHIFGTTLAEGVRFNEGGFAQALQSQTRRRGWPLSANNASPSSRTGDAASRIARRTGAAV